VGPKLEYGNLHVVSIGNPLTRVPRSLSLRSKNSSLLCWNKKLAELPMKVLPPIIKTVRTKIDNLPKEQSV
jgi:hypothetical protein